MNTCKKERKKRKKIEMLFHLSQPGQEMFLARSQWKQRREEVEEARASRRRAAWCNHNFRITMMAIVGELFMFDFFPC